MFPKAERRLAWLGVNVEEFIQKIKSQENQHNVKVRESEIEE